MREIAVPVKTCRSLHSQDLLRTTASDVHLPAGPPLKPSSLTTPRVGLPSDSPNDSPADSQAGAAQPQCSAAGAPTQARDEEDG